MKLEEITLRVIPDQSTALTAFESGQIDGVLTVPTDDLPRLKAESDDLYVVPQFGTTYFIMNLEKEPFTNPKVRQALSLAIDRGALIEKGAGSPPTPPAPASLPPVTSSTAKTSPLSAPTGASSPRATSRPRRSSSKRQASRTARASPQSSSPTTPTTR